jgi:SAM-dependent methyltransferase
MLTVSQPNSKEIARLVIAEFSSKPVVDHFIIATKSGFWPSEQALIKRYFRLGSRVLDLGCGAGRTTLPLARAGFDVVGVDISPMMIAAARELAAGEGVTVRYEVGDAVQLQFANGMFDHVVFSNQGWTQIPGVHNRLRALCEIRRVLTDGGVVLLSTHTRPCAALHPAWALRWLRWYGRKAFRMDYGGIDFGDLLFVRRLPGEHSLKQYVHIPTRTHVHRLLRSESFEVLETIREQSMDHKPLVYIARLTAKGT